MSHDAVNVSHDAVGGAHNAPTVCLHPRGPATSPTGVTANWFQAPVSAQCEASVDRSL